MAERALRADARRNRERVLAAAAEAFAASGIGVPLDEIAVRAGVGPGTVYRHFPTKEALFEAVALARVQAVAADAQARTAADDPAAAFDGFLGVLADQAVNKRDLPEALAGAGSPAVAEAVAQLHVALGTMLVRAQEAGAVRPEIRVDDLVALLKGLLLTVGASDDPGLHTRVLAVLRDGMRPPR